MLEIKKFYSGVAGMNLLILGGIHGNEPCGSVAISKVISQFESGELSLKKGSVTFVPVCNPKAAALDTRYVDRDLNRYMSPIKNPQIYEDDLTNALCPLLEQADILLDLHSYRVGGVPFAFIRSPDSPEVAFAKAVGVEHMVYGFQNAHKNSDNVDSYEAIRASMGTTEYMRQFKGVGVTVECGKNGSQESYDFAHKAILNGLTHLKMIDGAPIVLSSPSIFEIQKIHSRRENEDFSVGRVFNFASFNSGDVITHKQGVAEVVAQGKSVVVLPDFDASVDEDWFYLGRQLN